MYTVSHTLLFRAYFCVVYGADSGLIGWPRAALVNTFFTMFSTHIPLIHRPTWTMEDKHPMLVSAMQACGAIFLKTQVSLAFVQRTLDHLGDSLIAEFVSSFSTARIMRPLRT